MSALSPLVLPAFVLSSLPFGKFHVAPAFFATSPSLSILLSVGWPCPACTLSVEPFFPGLSSPILSLRFVRLLYCSCSLQFSFPILKSFYFVHLPYPAPTSSPTPLGHCWVLYFVSPSFYALRLPILALAHSEVHLFIELLRVLTYRLTLSHQTWVDFLQSHLLHIPIGPFIFLPVLCGYGCRSTRRSSRFCSRAAPVPAHGSDFWTTSSPPFRLIVSIEALH